MPGTPDPLRTRWAVSGTDTSMLLPGVINHYGAIVSQVPYAPRLRDCYEMPDTALER